MSSSNRPQLGPMLRAERRRRHLSLRDLSDLIGVSVNTLSRVERGHLPDLRNYQRLVEWLDVPADTFLEQTTEEHAPDTLDLVIRHLRSDTALTPAAVEKLANVVREMYIEMTSPAHPAWRSTCGPPRHSRPQLELCSPKFSVRCSRASRPRRSADKCGEGSRLRRNVSLPEYEARPGSARTPSWTSVGWSATSARPFVPLTN